MYRIRQAQTERERIWPWKAHGNVIEVGKHGISEMDLDHASTLIVTFEKDGKQAKYAIKDWVYAEFAEVSIIVNGRPPTDEERDLQARLNMQRANIQLPEGVTETKWQAGPQLVVQAAKKKGAK